MKRICTFLLALMITGSANASEKSIVVSIKPVHSLVASVTEGIVTPELIVKGVESLHGYQLKPSDAKLLEDADVIVWIGPTMESTLKPSISNAREDTKVIEVGEMHGLILYETRESPDEHHGHGHEEHGHSEEGDEEDHHDEEHGHGEEDHHDEEHGHGEEEHHAEKAHHDEEHHDGKDEHHGEEEHHDEHGHAHGLYDLHVWLDISNAKVIAEETAEQIAHLFPEHEAQLASNVKNTHERLDALDAELRSLSKSFAGLPYVVFHDAYQYIEKMLGLNNVGTVTINPERAAGAKRLLELRETISETGATCVFKEPQFDPNAIEVISEGTDLKIGTLDPLGAYVEPGPHAYFQLMRDMVNSLKECLG